ncbi:uncharacterized protein LOC133886063 isoform X2 [Phragmites australis]|uniref:uncharacterized protein LOC133886063 isoform X2 n=1 Tax=Phragmites australis TaxID=29695 RepID=UPI002D7911BF|nr:uncharacterized protein LOC133886063 isoform X2 [Phragmites australis]
MHRLSAPSRLLLFYRASAPPRWWPPALARRDAPVMAAPSPLAHRVPRLPHGSRNMAISSRVKGELGKPDRRRLIPSAVDPIHASNDTRISLGKHFPVTQGMNNEENRGAIEEFIGPYGYGCPANGEHAGRKIVHVIYGDEDACRITVEVTDGKQDPREATEDVIALCSDGRPGNDEENTRGQSASEVSDDEECLSWTAEMPTCYPRDGVPRALPLLWSSHRDGSIYRDNCHWKKEFRIADRNETRLEAMMLSDPSKHCILNGETCVNHRPCAMWQIFSLKLAKILVDGGSVELYGYIAARDNLDQLLNYVVNISRDDPIIVEQGSLIEMTGPKRGIDLSSNVLIEYDIRIKRGDREKDDLQLIDVEATVEVIISEVQSSFDLCLSCFTSGLHEEIRLFDGSIGESCGLRRHVVAVQMGTSMDLMFKIGSGSYCSAEHCCSFKAVNHGCASQQIKIELASILVKVTWSTLNFFLL